MKKYATYKHVTGKDIQNLRLKLNLTQAEFAQLVNVSLKTVERWEYENKELTGAIVTLVYLLREYPQMAESLKIMPKQYPLRLWYMYKDRICTIIDADERKRKVAVVNYTTDYLYRAFGKNDSPTFEEYEEFLESRCFPRTRDKMKIMLKELELPFYDPLLIIEKTEGRMAEDDFWIRIER